MLPAINAMPSYVLAWWYMSFVCKAILVRIFATVGMSAPCDMSRVYSSFICSCFKKCVLACVVTLLNSHPHMSRCTCSTRATGFVDYMRSLLVCWCCLALQDSLLSYFIEVRLHYHRPPFIVLILTLYQTNRLHLQWLLEWLPKGLISRTFWGSFCVST